MMQDYIENFFLQTSTDSIITQLLTSTDSVIIQLPTNTDSVIITGL